MRCLCFLYVCVVSVTRHMCMIVFYMTLYVCSVFAFCSMLDTYGTCALVLWTHMLCCGISCTSCVYMYTVVRYNVCCRTVFGLQLLWFTRHYVMLRIAHCPFLLSACFVCLSVIILYVLLCCIMLYMIVFIVQYYYLTCLLTFFVYI